MSVRKAGLDANLQAFRASVREFLDERLLDDLGRKVTEHKRLEKMISCDRTKPCAPSGGLPPNWPVEHGDSSRNKAFNCTAESV